MTKKNIIKIGIITLVLGISVGSFFLYNKPQKDSSEDLIITNLKIKLVDAFSEQAITNTSVRIYSDNGIRCITSPCPTDGQGWTGQSDENGFIYISKKVFNLASNISATGYKSGTDPVNDSQKISDSYWVVELDADSKIDNNERRLKLIDSITKAPISKSLIWIANNIECFPPQCSDFKFNGKTNSLGNVYYPNSADVTGGLFIGDDRFIIVPNYKATKLSSGWANYIVTLEKNN